MSAPPTIKPIVVLDPKAISIRYDRHGGVEVHMPDGAVLHRVRLVEAFPVTRRRRLVVLFDRDGEEIGIVREPQQLDAESDEVVHTALDRSYFLSRITVIHRVEERYGIATWHVTTDRGPRTFELRSRSESVWWLGPQRILIKDAHGNRYEIVNLNRLDHRSRVLAELHL